MKRVSMLTAGAAALIWTAAWTTPAFAQSAGSAGSAGSQAGSSQGLGTQGTAGQDAGTHDAGAQDETTSQPGDQDREATRAGGDDRDRRDMQRFVERAAIASMAEVQLGQLGADRAQNPEVKAFAAMMVEEHTKALEQLRSVASAQGVELPSDLDDKHRRMHEKLSNTQSDRFDREFMSAMVKTHRDTEKLLRKQSERGSRGQMTAAPPAPEAGTAARADGTDEDAPAAVGTSGVEAAPATDATQWAAMTLPKVIDHLEQARSLEQQVKDSGRGANDGSNDDSTAGADQPR